MPPLFLQEFVSFVEFYSRGPAEHFGILSGSLCLSKLCHARTTDAVSGTFHFQTKNDVLGIDVHRKVKLARIALDHIEVVLEIRLC